MSVPVIQGYNGATPYDWLKILDTTDARAFSLGLVAPGGTVSNYEAYWRNLGYAKLYDGQLSLIAHPTLDLGAAGDTTDVMALAASATDALAAATAATASNTSGWTTPLPDPFESFIDVFQAGIIWTPPALATPGTIRKAFQWDGAYYPDTWDYKWYPLANEYLPSDASETHPWVIAEGAGAHHQKILTDVLAPTGYELDLWVPITAGDYVYFTHPDSGSYPWRTAVSNATGYVIRLYCAWETSVWGEGYTHGVWAEDGTREWKLRWHKTGSTYSIQALAADGFASTQVCYLTPAYHTIKIVVQGTSLQVYVDGSLQLTGTLNAATTDKTLSFGGLVKPVTGSHYGTMKLASVEYYCGGTTTPSY